MLILSYLVLAFLNPTEVIALHYAGCRIITRPIDANTVAVKWVCPN